MLAGRSPTGKSAGVEITCRVYKPPHPVSSSAIGRRRAREHRPAHRATPSPARPARDRRGRGRSGRAWRSRERPEGRAFGEARRRASGGAEGDGGSVNLAASAVSGQTPPAGPQWVSGLQPLEPHPLAYDKALCASLDGRRPPVTFGGAADGSAPWRVVLSRPPLACAGMSPPRVSPSRVLRFAANGASRRFALDAPHAAACGERTSASRAEAGAWSRLAALPAGSRRVRQSATGGDGLLGHGDSAVPPEGEGLE